MFGKALLLLVSSSFAASASAQTSDRANEEDARQAFQKGVEAESAGDRAGACAAFRRSLSLLRELGPLRKSTDCDVREGKLLSARAAFDELIRRWPRAGAEVDGLKAERAAVDARIARLTLELREGAVATARVDGVAVALPSTTELDPGSYEVVVEEPGKAATRIPVSLEEGRARTMIVPDAPTTEAGSNGPSGLLIGGIVGLGVGGLALVGAGITGGLVLAKDSDHEACLADAGPDCVVLADEGETLLTANTALWIVGLVGAGVGATLLIVEAATGPSVEATVGPGSASLRVRF